MRRSSAPSSHFYDCKTVNIVSVVQTLNVELKNSIMSKASKLFDRNVPGSTEILGRSTVGIAGCGGLGSNAAVALARAGIGTLIIADHDIVEESNLNRQHYFQSDIGKRKVTALAKHLKAINPQIKIKAVKKRLYDFDVPEVFKQADLLIEALDRAEAKSWLIEAWCSAFPDRPLVCASGLSGIGKTEELKVQRAGNIYVVGDGTSDMSMGLCSARVAIAANMEANIALELLIKGRDRKNDKNK